MQRVIEYIKGTKSEMKHVSWPSRQQVGVFTILVIAASLSTAIFLGLFDYAFSTALSLALPDAPPAPVEQVTSTGALEVETEALPPESVPSPSSGLDFDIQ